MTCERCGGSRPEWSHRLGCHACARCYFRTFTDAERQESERIAQQRTIATVIGRAAVRVKGRRRELADRALLIELADDPLLVQELLAETARLGVKVRRRP